MNGMIEISVRSTLVHLHFMRTLVLGTGVVMTEHKYIVLPYEYFQLSAVILTKRLLSAVHCRCSCRCCCCFKDAIKFADNVAVIQN